MQKLEKKLVIGPVKSQASKRARFPRETEPYIFLSRKHRTHEKALNKFLEINNSVNSVSSVFP